MHMAPSKVTVRMAYPDEAEELQRRYRESVLVAYQHIFSPDRYPFPDQSVRETWCALVADNERRHQLFVADVDGAVVGAIVAKPGSIAHLFVVPMRWGTGVADTLLATAVAVSRGAGVNQCQLEVLEDNWRARRFYERHGWVRDHRRRAAAYPPYPVVIGYTFATSSVDLRGEPQPPKPSPSTSRVMPCPLASDAAGVLHRQYCCASGSCSPPADNHHGP